MHTFVYSTCNVTCYNIMSHAILEYTSTYYEILI